MISLQMISINKMARRCRILLLIPSASNTYDMLFFCIFFNSTYQKLGPLDVSFFLSCNHVHMLIASTSLYTVLFMKFLVCSRSNNCRSALDFLNVRQKISF